MAFEESIFFSIEIRSPGRILTSFGSMVIVKGEKRLDLAVVQREYKFSL